MAQSPAKDDDLTEVERRLVDSVGRGVELDLAGDEPIDEAAMTEWGESMTVRATVIRDVLRGRHVSEPDPHGVQLRGARIVSRLDLEGVSTDVPLTLTACYLTEGASVRGAQLPALRLRQCRAENSSMPSLDAEGLRTQVLDLRGLSVITDFSDGAAVSLLGAHIDGLLLASQAALINDTGPALDADGLQCDGGLFLNRLIATGSGDLGAVRLLGAHIGGLLNVSNSTVINHTGPALFADILRVDDSLLLNRFKGTGSGDLGAVRLLGGHIGSQVDASGATLTNDDGPALVADGLQVGGAVFLTDGFAAIGSGKFGAVRLLGGHIGSQFGASRATLTNHDGPALYADGLQVDGDLFLRVGFAVIGSGRQSAVRLQGARIGGQFGASGVTLTNDEGPALSLAGLRVDGNLDLRDGFQATGSGDNGAVNLAGAHVGGRIRLDAATIRDPSGKPGKLALDGLVYAGLPKQPRAEEWLDMLQERTNKYSSQPYRQLAEASKAAGHDALTRKILMAQRQRQLAQRQTTRIERLWGKVTYVTLGYGYQPWRALIGLLGIVTLAVILSVSYGAHGGLAHTKASQSPGTQCSALERVGVGLDFAIPVVRTGAGGSCATTQTLAGNTITISGWVLQLAAWSLATLFIAGFTGAVRKT